MKKKPTKKKLEAIFGVKVNQTTRLIHGPVKREAYDAASKTLKGMDSDKFWNRVLSRLQKKPDGLKHS